MSASVIHAKDMHRVYNKDDLKLRSQCSTYGSNCTKEMHINEIVRLDPCLSDAQKSFETIGVGEYSLDVSDHSKLFAETTTDVDSVDQQIVMNDMLLMTRDSPRYMFVEHNIEKIDCGCNFFSDGVTIVPPYTPVFEKSLQPSLIKAILENHCDSNPITRFPVPPFDKQFVTKVTYVCSDCMFIRLGPFFVDDATEDKQYLFEVSYCKVKTREGTPVESYKWTTWLLADAHSSREQRIHCPTPTAGSYVCCVRVFNSKDHEEKSKWSEESAEFVIVE